MNDPTRAFYDDLAESYHLLFQDWTQSIQRQAGVLGPLIEHEMSMGGLRILDCACGIGTQTLGLSQRGHALMGVDLSETAISRARREAEQRSLSIQFEIGDMRDLSSLSATAFDVVLAVDCVSRTDVHELGFLSQQVDDGTDQMPPHTQPPEHFFILSQYLLAYQPNEADILHPIVEKLSAGVLDRMP